MLGGLIGAAVCAGVDVHWSTVVDRVLIPLLAAPVIGFALAFAVMLAILWIFRHHNPHRVFGGFRVVQVVSAAALALGHGLQDAQKTMGVIFLAVTAGGYYSSTRDLPLWIVVVSATAISLGTYAGGHRIMRTVGQRLVHLDPARGFAAEAVGATVLYTAAYVFSAPISTTQTLTAAVVGAGSTGRRRAVRWGVARSVALGWLLTLPATALLAAAAYTLLHLLVPT